MLLHKIVALIAVLAITVPASAQFSNSGSRSTSEELCKSYNRIGISYTNTGLSAKNYHFFFYFKESDHLSLNGVAIDYIHGFSLSSTLPMFIETGLKANFGFGAVNCEDDWLSAKLQMQDISLSVPVNFAYKFGISDNITITPYLGLNFKLHLLGRCKSKYDYANDSYDDNDSYSRWRNIYSKDDMLGETWNRFQLGWHIGAGVNFKKLYLGVNYGTDFNKAYKREVNYDYEDTAKKGSVTSGNLTATVGYTF